MTTFTMRYVNGHFVVTGPDISLMRFKSRAEASDWCKARCPGWPIKETPANSSDSFSAASAPRER
jgi:hypothetical protein